MTRSTIAVRPAAPPATRETPWKTRIALFALVGAILIALQWHLINRVNLEVGDFAANGLMIVKAKSSFLLDGNYSRVGFYHPGPAILYVLAAGEIVLHDWLGVVPSGFSGQLVAVSLYDAAWLVMLFVLARRMTASVASASLIMGGFALALSFFDDAILNDPWMPHLYCLPFATVLLAGARLVEGSADSMVPLGAACGFLLNGHVSFMSTLPIIFLILIAASGVNAYRGGTFLMSKSFLVMHKRQILAFFGLIVFFMLPLLTLTVFRFPGPLQSYAKFGGHNKANTLYQAFIFMRAYWGGTALAACTGAALCTMLATHAHMTKDQFGRAVQAMLVMVLAATLALVFYAKFGVDMLDQSYIGLFYFVVPALVVGCAVAAAAHACLATRQTVVSIGLALLLMAGAAWREHASTESKDDYNHRGIADLYRSMKAIPQHQGRMVLDLDWADDQNYVWSNMIGLQLYALRRHDPFICFGRNWSFANTWQAQCTTAEIAHSPHYVVRKDSRETGSVAQGLGLSVYMRRLLNDVGQAGPNSAATNLPLPKAGRVVPDEPVPESSRP